MAIKRAKTLDDAQFDILMSYLARGNNPLRDRVMFALSFKCGLRAKEIAGLNWSDVVDVQGNVYATGSVIDLSHKITKGGKVDSKIIMHPLVYDCLCELQKSGTKVILPAPRTADGRMTYNNVTVYMHAIYKSLGFQGCSSHSGRRTFGTKLARSCNLNGGSITDVQELMRHSDIRTTRIYIDPSDTQKNMIMGI
jgi:integrase